MKTIVITFIGLVAIAVIVSMLFEEPKYKCASPRTPEVCVEVGSN